VEGAAEDVAALEDALEDAVDAPDELGEPGLVEAELALLPLPLLEVLQAEITSPSRATIAARARADRVRRRGKVTRRSYGTPLTGPPDHVTAAARISESAAAASA
jgi:hypothetical protein